MVSNAEIINVIVEKLIQYEAKNIVVDPTLYLFLVKCMIVDTKNSAAEKDQ
jgi:hydroxymethylpyrimidine/phosphomethylpyrimidine kinase